MPRSGSLGWVVLAGTISVIIAGAMWGILDSLFVDRIAGTDIWQAPTGSVLETGRTYVLETWNWFLLIVLSRLSIEAIVASRLRGASTNIPAATLVLLSGHLILVTWMLVFPEIAGAFYDEAAATQQVADAGYMAGVDLAFEWGIGILPAVMLLLADIWYLSAPIRNDFLRA